LLNFDNIANIEEESQPLDIKIQFIDLDEERFIEWLEYFDYLITFCKLHKIKLKQLLKRILNDNFSITTEAFITYLFLMLVLIYILSFVENLKENFFRYYML
jgi:hypothetical protein